MSSNFSTVTPATCDHVAIYYQKLWENHKCIAWNLLRRGYTQWSRGYVETRTNNLFELNDGAEA